MNTIIIGGGWSGLAAAVRLSQQGQQVHLLESAKQLGGRARTVEWRGLQVDNGQHLLIGAYRHTLSMLADISADESQIFSRLPLDISILDPDYPDLRLTAGSGPWPLSLVWRLWRDNGFAVLHQVLRLTLQARRFNPQADISVNDWLKANRQSPRLIHQLWEPLCLATLNTPIASASAAIFARVLQDTFRRREDSDLLIPRRPLGQVFPEAAANYIRQQGSQVSLQTRVKQLEVENEHIKGVITARGDQLHADRVIVATPAPVSRQLLAPHVLLPEFDSHPIATVYLQYPAAIRLPRPVTGLSGMLGQWLFDRSDLSPGLIAVVISGPGEHEKLGKQALAERIGDEIKRLQPGWPAQASDSLVIREKKATFACTVDIQQQRPNNLTRITGLSLAGDFVANPYPATLEGAIINGEQTAKQLIA